MNDRPITIIIPAYNEGKRIATTLDEYITYFKKHYFGTWSLLVVLNGCIDNTVEIVESYAKKCRSLRYVIFDKPIGKGGAIIEGFKRAKTPLVGYVDADASTPPQAFHDLIAHLSSADGVIASRWMPGAVIRIEQTFPRRIASRCFNVLIRTLFMMPYKDTQTGAKVFTRDALRAVIPHIGITQWAFDIDLLYQLRKKRFRIIEVPSMWRDCAGSKLNVPLVSMQMLLAVVRLRLIHSPLSFLVTVYNKLVDLIWSLISSLSKLKSR